MSSVGIGTTLKTASKTGELQGITFHRDGYSVKGSKLDRSLSAGKIMEHFRTVEKAEQKSMEVPHQEMCHESKTKELAASLFEGNLGKSQEQEMKENPKKKNKIGHRR